MSRSLPSDEPRAFRDSLSGRWVEIRGIGKTTSLEVEYVRDGAVLFRAKVADIRYAMERWPFADTRL